MSKEDPTQNGRIFEFTLGNFLDHNITIHDANSNNLEYYADISRYSRNTPDVKLLARGSDGTVVGQAHFGWRSITCGLGPEENSMDWVELNPSGLFRKKYQFEYDGRKYSVVRTRDNEHSAEGTKRLSASHYQIVEETSQEVVAYYNSTSIIGTKKGAMTFKNAVSKSFEALILLSVVSVIEKTKRRAKAGAAAGAAGGAGG